MNPVLLSLAEEDDQWFDTRDVTHVVAQTPTNAAQCAEDHNEAEVERSSSPQQTCESEPSVTSVPRFTEIPRTRLNPKSRMFVPGTAPVMGGVRSFMYVEHVQCNWPSWDAQDDNVSVVSSEYVKNDDSFVHAQNLVADRQKGRSDLNSTNGKHSGKAGATNNRCSVTDSRAPGNAEKQHPLAAVTSKPKRNEEQQREAKEAELERRQLLWNALGLEGISASKIHPRIMFAN